jgi:hypothetical protein
MAWVMLAALSDGGPPLIHVICPEGPATLVLTMTSVLRECCCMSGRCTALRWAGMNVALPSGHCQGRCRVRFRQRCHRLGEGQV